MIKTNTKILNTEIVTRLFTPPESKITLKVGNEINSTHTPGSTNLDTLAQLRETPKTKTFEGEKMVS